MTVKYWLFIPAIVIAGLWLTFSDHDRKWIKAEMHSKSKWVYIITITITCAVIAVMLYLGWLSWVDTAVFFGPIAFSEVISVLRAPVNAWLKS